MGAVGGKIEFKGALRVLCILWEWRFWPRLGVGPAMGFIGMTIALGALVGPVIGGLLCHNYGYLAVFISGYAVRNSTPTEGSG